jgi:hypothetical protein
MPVPAYWPIRTMADSDFVQAFTFLQPGGLAPYNISGWLFDLTVYDTPGGLALYSFPSGAFGNGGSSGILTITEQRGVFVAAVGTNHGYYQLTEVDGGQSLPWFHGPLIVEAAAYP